MKRKILKELDLPEYKQPLNSVVEFLENLSYSAVKTKYNAKGNWDAVSIRGYSDDIGMLLKRLIVFSYLLFPFCYLTFFI